MEICDLSDEELKIVVLRKPSEPQENRERRYSEIMKTAWGIGSLFVAETFLGVPTRETVLGIQEFSALSSEFFCKSKNMLK